MAYSEPEVAILKKYRVLNPDGTLRTCNLAQPTNAGGQPPGPGPVMSPDVVNRLLRADTTPDKHWLDWIFFQAGGGQKAREATADALRQIRDRFIDERTNGWTHPENGQYQPPVPREQAEARWAISEPKFREVLAVCDQDAVKRLRTFGYFREWPGNGGLYEKVVDAIGRYLKFFPKLQTMNKEIAREGGEQLAETPSQIATWEQMVEITKKVERYFASKKARTDIRAETIYDDDVISAVAPLTYAASVKFGYDLWPWASRKGFEQVLSGEKEDWRFKDEWKQRTSKGNVFVFLTFKVPVPAWVARREGNWELKDLTDLALEMDKSNSKQDVNTWVVYDQENRNSLTVAQVKQMIMAEPTRVDPTDDESPITRGSNVYKDEAEAANVVASLDRALQSVKKWISKFDPKHVKSDVLTLD